MTENHGFRIRNEMQIRRVSHCPLLCHYSSLTVPSVVASQLCQPAHLASLHPRQPRVWGPPREQSLWGRLPLQHEGARLQAAHSAGHGQNAGEAFIICCVYVM